MWQVMMSEPERQRRENSKETLDRPAQRCVRNPTLFCEALGNLVKSLYLW